jgi:CRISPR-associated protein Cst2
MNKSITITTVYDTSAVNRDEKIGNNVLSTKKITKGNKIFSAISRVSQTHHFFNTLNSLNPTTWRETNVLPTGKGDKKVIQFDLTHENIITSAELDFFGYMGTESMNMRKSPVGMTKAISLIPWEGDLLFYANHGLVKRAKLDNPDIQPNPYSKEEHDSLFTGNITLNGNVLGKDYWLFKEAEIKEEENGFSVKSEKVIYSFDNFKKVDENTYENEKGSIIVEPNEQTKKAFKIIFRLKPEEKINRIKDFLKVVKNGIVFHSSGEAPGLNPVFLIAAIVDVPMPIFHGYIELDNTFSKIKTNNIINALDNQYIQNYYLYDGIKLLDKPIEMDPVKGIGEWNEFVDTFIKEVE